MPKYVPTEDEMDSLYSSDKPVGDKPATEETGDDESPESVDEESEPTALIPKSTFGGKTPKEGQTVTLRVVKDYGDEVEVALGTEDKPNKPMGMSSDEEIDAMDKDMGMGMSMMKE